jgi:hypothetical protein
MNRVAALTRAAGVVLFVSTGCASTPARQSELWPILRRYAADDSNIDRPMRVVARDWAGYWQLGLPEIDVNWDEEMVLVAALGPTTRPGTGVRIREISWNGTVLVPRVEITRSDAELEPGSAGPLETRSPYELVVVPASDENVSGFTSRPPPPPRSKKGGGIPLPGLR